MSYPGNQAISPEVQQRIRSTFEQTLSLAEKGQRQQAAMGCDFILQLDPDYRPAKTLQQRLTASADGGGVDVEDLRGQLEGRPSAAEREAEARALFEETRPGVTMPDGPPGGNETILAGSFEEAQAKIDSQAKIESEATMQGEEADDDPFDLDDLPDLPLPGDDDDLLGLGEAGEDERGDTGLGDSGLGDTDLGDTGLGDTGLDGPGSDFDDDELALPDFTAPEPEGAPAAPATPAATPAPAPAAAGGDLRSRLQAGLEARRFDEVVELAQRHRDQVAADPEMARVATLAGERREAAPYVERFVDAAARARQKGDLDEAATLTEKARALDPSHPALAAPAPPASAEPAADLAGDDLGGAVPSLDDFDFDSGDAEGDRRIAELLDDGQGAFDRGDYQGAIDAWSRIFLIDIDHEEASNRIEEARRLKNEEDRRVEEVYHDAVKAAEDGRTAEAREGFETVLGLAPGYAAAREQLERLDAGQAVAPVGDAPPATAAGTAPTGGPAIGGTAPGGVEDEMLREQIMIPPDPGEEGATADVEGGVGGPKGRTMVASSGPASRRFLLIAGLVLVVGLVAGYFVYQERASLFPNAAEPPSEETAQVDPVDRATALHESGKTAMAINILRRLPPTAPQYEEAQALISQWQAETETEVAEEPVEEIVERAASQEDLLAAAAAAAEAGQNLRARDLLGEAQNVAELPSEAQALEARVDSALAALQSSLTMIEQGEYTRALPELWRRHEADPDNPDVRRLITDSYYNLAIRALQQGDAETAAEHLEEAAEMSPGGEMERHLRFARTYSSREKDLLYRIYVKYLPTR